MPPPTAPPEHAPKCCGLDLHKCSAVLHVCTAAGERLFRGTVDPDPDAILAALARFRPLVVGIEATTGADDLADALTAAGIECRVGHPDRIRTLLGAAKTDAKDAEGIAKLLVLGVFPAVARVPPAVRDVRELLRRRASFVGMRQGVRARHTLTRPRRRGRPRPPGGGMVNEMHFSHPDGLALACDAAAEKGLSAPIDQLEREGVRRVERLFPTVYPRLLAIPGVGPLTAAVICAEVGDIERFADAGKLLAYCRLVRPERTSGGRVVGLGKAKECNQQLRSAFLNAAGHALIHCPAARAWAALRFPAADQRGLAMSVTASRLAEGIYHVWGRGVPFDPARAFPSPDGEPDGRVTAPARSARRANRVAEGDAV